MTKSYLVAFCGGWVAGMLLQFGDVPFTWHNIAFIGGALLVVYITGVAAEASRGRS